jgi:hypothetical protein
LQFPMPRRKQRKKTPNAQRQPSEKHKHKPKVLGGIKIHHLTKFPVIHH